MTLIDLTKPPIDLSWTDMMSESDLIYGEDPGTVPVGPDGKDLRWEGEQIDGYAEVADPYEQRKKREKAARRMSFDRAVQRELPHVQPAPEPVRLYVARLRAAMRMGLDADAVHATYYEGKRPEGVEKLEGSAFAREARWAKRNSTPPTAYRKEHLQEGDISQGDVQEASYRGAAAGSAQRPARGRAAGRAYHNDGERFLDEILGVDQAMTGFAQNDRVQSDHDDTSKGVVEEVQSDGAVKVRRDAGGEVTYSGDAAKGLQRQASMHRCPECEKSWDEHRGATAGAIQMVDGTRLGMKPDPECELCGGSGQVNDETLDRYEDAQAENEWHRRDKWGIKQANQRGVPDQHHAPKGAHGAAEKGQAGDASADANVTLDDPSLLPENELVAVLKWPNLTVLSGAIPKMAAGDWFDGIDAEINRELGSWSPDKTSYELSARFASREGARRFAKKLVADYQVQPQAVQGSFEKGDGRFMRVANRDGAKTALRVDTARRVLFPGGYVFALEGSPMPGNFQIGDGVLVADEQTNTLSEGKVAAVGPDVAIIAAYDGQQYAYARGLFKKIHLARLSLTDAKLGMLPAKQRVVVGVREGTLMEFDDARARVLFEDGPRWFSRDRVTAILRVAELS